MTRSWRAGSRTSPGWWHTAAPRGPRQPAAGHRSVGPCQLGQHRFGARAAAQGHRAVGDSPINELMLAWYDHFLKGAEQRTWRGTPRVDYFLMGANTWKTAPSWPLPQNTLDRLLPVRRRRARRPRRGTHRGSRRPRNRPTSTPTTPPTRRRAWAATPAAAHSPVRRGPTTRRRSSSAPTCWCTAATPLTARHRGHRTGDGHLWARRRPSTPISPRS